MKTWNLRRALSAALTGVAFALAAPTGVAAADAPSEAQIASLAGRVESARPPATATTPFTLYIEDASGNAFRLVRVEGSGWKYADGWTASESRAGSLLQEVTYDPSEPERAAEVTSNVGEPLTVFIDGPSGFTYVYNQEGGWKFVGKLADRRD